MATLREAIEAAASDQGFDDADDMLEFFNMHGLEVVFKQPPLGSPASDLTDDERAELCNPEEMHQRYVGAKALRVIDAHAADRAALVAQVAQLTAERNALTEAVERRDQGISDLRAHIAELTRELGEAQESAVNNSRCLELAIQREEVTAQALQASQANAGVWFDRAHAAEAQVAELTRERDLAERAADAAIAGNEVATQRARDAELRADDIGRLGKEHIEQLRGLLENEEKNHAFTKSETATERAELLRQCDLLRGERDVAEARVRDAEARVRELKPIRDDLRAMFRRWHTLGGANITADSTTIEKAILALDRMTA